MLEGDAKTYDTTQVVKFEYGSDLNWLVPYPGDWHLLKNYQIYLMKPLFEAGLKDLAMASGYPALSIQSCSNFLRTHHFLMEAREGLYRYMLKQFQKCRTALTPPVKVDVQQAVNHTLQEFTKDAADFTVFDHPIYQKFITKHIQDVLQMPHELLEYFKTGSFTVSISGHAFPFSWVGRKS